MSTNKTRNLNLHSWTLDDPVKMAEFNENFSAIDASFGLLSGAVAEKAELVLGSYSGNNAATQSIALGFQPKAVLVMDSFGQTAYTTSSFAQVYGGLAMPGKPVSENGYTSLEVTAAGFAVHNYGSEADRIRINRSGKCYYYLAIKYAGRSSPGGELLFRFWVYALIRSLPP